MQDELTVPEAVVVERRRRPSAIWIIPVVAALVGAWLTWKTIADRGHAFTLTLRAAEGLEAGKTAIRYRDVQLGLVESLELSPDLMHVIVGARLEKGFERYLTDRTRFWIVRAQISAGRVTGLGTILSGAYIGVDPVADGAPRRAFEGLEVPPLVASGEAGRRFLLRAPSRGSLEIGAPIYFRQVQVGEVVRTELDASGDFVNIDVFVRAPHHDRVRAGSRFWNSSGFDARIDESGVQVDTESFVAMVIGGVGFDSPKGDPGPPAEEGHVFALAPSERESVVEQYVVKQRILAHFDGSVRGLASNAPVEFRGIRVGQVADVRLEYDSQAETLKIPVVLEIEPERIGILGGDSVAAADRLARLVERGLRAQLKVGNLLTGQLLVDLDLHPELPRTQMKLGGDYPEIPTIPTPLDELAGSITRLLGKAEQLPIDQIAAEANGAVRALHGTLEQTRLITEALNQGMIPQVQGAVGQATATMHAAEGTLKSVSRMFGPDSAMNVELSRTLVELTEAARALRLLADHLDRHPENLIQGRANP